MFLGSATPLTERGLKNATINLGGVDEAAIWAVIEVETTGCGFLADKRPQMLFERHIFRRLTEGKFDAHPDISAPVAGDYGAAGANQYKRLEKAMTLDKGRALESASWGLGQIMGFNAKRIRYADVEAMIQAFAENEDNQLEGLVSYCLTFGLDDELRRHDWMGFAYGYNGVEFYKHSYDLRLAAAHQKFQKRPVDLGVRSTQVELYYKGLLKITDIDGIMGPRTEKALLSSLSVL